jgi:hypothetical protein
LRPNKKPALAAKAKGASSANRKAENQEFSSGICERLGMKLPVAAGKAANLEGERPLPSIARFRTASIAQATTTPSEA